MRLIRVVLVVLGSLFLGLALLGVLLPGLPTTPFVLLAAACYLRSSPRLYRGLLAHRTFGKLIRDYQDRRTIPRSAKVVSLAAMAGMIGVSVLLLVEALWLKALLVALGVVGCTVVLRLRTTPSSPPEGAKAGEP